LKSMANSRDDCLPPFRSFREHCEFASPLEIEIFALELAREVRENYVHCGE